MGGTLLAYLVTEDYLCKSYMSRSVFYSRPRNFLMYKSKVFFTFNIENGGFLPFRSVGVATAAFALAVLEGSTQPGVWFPEEVCSSVI